MSLFGKSERLRNTLNTAASLQDNDSHFNDILITPGASEIKMKKNLSRTFAHESAQYPEVEPQFYEESKHHSQKSSSRMDKIAKHFSDKDNSIDGLSYADLDDSNDVN